jgi:UDP-2,4-diacetamido-2,4,6-trideoxy-beta-L-altropyranose hydrolase
VSGAGGTARELARVGTPQVAIVLAENQRPAGRELGEHGVAVDAGWHADVTADRLAATIDALARDPARRTELSRRGRELIDGRGALRVLAAMGLTASPAAAA